MEEKLNVSGRDKLMGVLCYLGIFILIPIIAKKTEFTKFHLNQGLILVVLQLIAIVISFIPQVGAIIESIINIIAFVLMIIGIINVIQSKEAQLPVVGKYKLYK